MDEEFLKEMKEGAPEEGQAPTQQQLDSEKVQIFTHMNKVFGYSHASWRHQQKNYKFTWFMCAQALFSPSRQTRAGLHR